MRLLQSSRATKALGSLMRPGDQPNRYHPWLQGRRHRFSMRAWEARSMSLGSSAVYWGCAHCPDLGPDHFAADQRSDARAGRYLETPILLNAVRSCFAPTRASVAEISTNKYVKDELHPAHVILPAGYIRVDDRRLGRWAPASSQADEEQRRCNEVSACWEAYAGRSTEPVDNLQAPHPIGRP